ncbi:EF-hand domain-containing protein [Aurantiacibacter spongiae]|nr:hypothetical protein [Aurantiacibacter spongiae]
MKKIVTIALATAALGIGGTAALAQADADATAHRRGAETTRVQTQARAAAMFARMDANGDGVLSQADREARARARFEAMDADGNGAVTFAEMQAHHRDMRGMRGDGQRRDRGERMGHRGGLHGAMMGLRAGTGSDGSISQSDFVSAALARFDAADANSDGTVTREERRARWSERRAGRNAAEAR